MKITLKEAKELILSGQVESITTAITILKKIDESDIGLPIIYEDLDDKRINYDLEEAIELVSDFTEIEFNEEHNSIENTGYYED